jgi:YfiH family protein
MKVFKDDGFTKACGTTISYGFYGRTGGVSTGLYASLNCGTGSNDVQTHVAQNRNMIAKNLGVAGGGVSTVWQCHSSLCLSIKSHVTEGDNRPKADALVTDVAGLAIGVLTADCGPVLFIGKKENAAPVIGAAHAGWGGALGGILEDTVAKMAQEGAVLETIEACVGPCIMQASYEVGQDFANPFLEKHEEAERFFKAGQKERHLMFDLPGYIAFRLSACGVKTVRLMGVDTYKEEAGCFSYRRATHKGEGDYGRQMSCIVINP